MQGLLPGLSGLRQEESGLGRRTATSDGVDAVPFVGSSTFIPSLMEKAGRAGLSRPRAGTRLLVWSFPCPTWLYEGFSDPGMGCSLPKPEPRGQEFGVCVCLLWVFLDLRRGGKADIMTPLHPSPSASEASEAPALVLFSFFSAFISFFPFSFSLSLPPPLPRSYSNLFSVYLVIWPCSCRTCVTAFGGLFSVYLRAIWVGGFK